MFEKTQEKREKKVEYVELIYDLIFVYIIGRNNSLLHQLNNGFVDYVTFLIYLTCTLAVIQLWTLTTYYINVYGDNSIKDHLMLFTNMFLLYFIGEGTRQHWQTHHSQYHIAWALILLNIGIHYLMELPACKEAGDHRRRIILMSSVNLGEALMVLGAIVEFHFMGTTYLSLTAIILSMGITIAFGRNKGAAVVDFTHLTERAMLYVVFTFGEMIIAIAGYFGEEFHWSSLYFALMAFLIVVGLFLSYGMLYDHIIDREKETNGLGYMFIHIFIIFALNCITTSLEFMRHDYVKLLPKMILLIGSLLLYFTFLFATERYAKPICRNKGPLMVKMAAMAVVFAVLMLLLRENMYLNIALSVLFVFIVFFVLYDYSRKVEKNGSCNLPNE